MKNDVLKTPQLLTRSNLRTNNEIKIEVTDDTCQQPPVGVHNFSRKNVFGWGFPEVEDDDDDDDSVERKKNIIDMNWLNEYNDEIDNLQVVIKKERSLSFQSETGKTLERRSSHKSDASDLEGSISSTHSFEIEFPIRSLGEHSYQGDDERSSQKRPSKLDNGFLQVNQDEMRSSTPLTDVYCSIRSCASRDSGISANDDICDALPDSQMDRSLLAELEGVCENERIELDKDQPVQDTTPAASLQIKRSKAIACDSTNAASDTSSSSSSPCKYPVWYKRFSIGRNDLILNFNTLTWPQEPEFEEEEEEISPFDIVKEDDPYDSLLSRSDKGSSSSSGVGGGGSEGANEAETESDRRRQSLKSLWTICDKLEASALREGQKIKGLSEIMELVDTLSKIDSRLEILKCDLQGLTKQATESRNELNTLQKRTSNLLASTESSRHHMTQLFCLERLEERLQKEWWNVHYPEFAKLEENYIV